MFYLLPQILIPALLEFFEHHCMCNLDKYETIPLSSRRPHVEPIGCHRKNKTSFLHLLDASATIILLAQALSFHQHLQSMSIRTAYARPIYNRMAQLTRTNSTTQQAALPLVLQAGPHGWETECKAAHRHPSLVQQLQMKYWYQLLSDRSYKAKHTHLCTITLLHISSSLSYCYCCETAHSIYIIKC